MEVTRYLFKSPSTSQVQVGTPDPSAKKEAKAQEQAQEETGKLTKETNTTLKQAEAFVSTQTKDVQPVVKADVTVAVEKAEDISKVNPNASTVGQAKQAKNDIWSKGSDTAQKIRENIWTNNSDNKNSRANNIWSHGNNDDSGSQKVKPTVESDNQSARIGRGQSKKVSLDIFA